MNASFLLSLSLPQGHQYSSREIGHHWLIDQSNKDTVLTEPRTYIDIATFGRKLKKTTTKGEPHPGWLHILVFFSLSLRGRSISGGSERLSYQVSARFAWG